MNYFLFNNSINLAKAVDHNDEIDSFFIDLEIIGKEKRQKNRNTLISYHEITDISKVRSFLNKTTLGVRTNPIYENIKKEINECISMGAEVLMLPMFRTIEEINYYIELVNGRSQIDLLFETPESLRLINQIPYKDIRFIHFGINDLSIALNYKLIFEMYIDQNLFSATDYLIKNNLVFGIGGVGAIGSLPISPELIFSAAITHGAKRIILSRSFISKLDFNNISHSLTNNLDSLNNLYKNLKSFPDNKIEEKFNFFSRTISELKK